MMKVSDFHLTCKGICHFLLVIHSNFGFLPVTVSTYGQFSVEKRTFLPFHSTPNLKMFPFHWIYQILYA